MEKVKKEIEQGFIELENDGLTVKINLSPELQAHMQKVIKKTQSRERKALKSLIKDMRKRYSTPPI